MKRDKGGERRSGGCRNVEKGGRKEGDLEGLWRLTVCQAAS